MSKLGPASAMKMQRAVAQTEREAEMEPDDDDDANPFRSRDWRLFLYAWSGFAVRVLIVLGGVFSILQYLDAKEEKRVERTLELVELWEEEPYQQAQRAVAERLDTLNAQYAGLLGQGAGAAERTVFMERIGIEAMAAGSGFRSEVDRIVYFLNRMAFCVEGNLCSAAMVDSYFGDFAHSFWDYFNGFIEQERAAGATNFAVPLERYVAASAR